MNTAEYLASLAKKGAAKTSGSFGKMCSDCAFRLNQPHTTDFLIAGERALFQLMSEGKFNCHTDDHNLADRPCVGFLYAKNAIP